MKKKIAIITTHPIQYNAPLFKLLTDRSAVEIKVFYSWGTKVLENKFDPGFGKIINWDIPLLEGYSFEFLENTAKEQGSHHFNGIINPDIIEKIQAYNPHCLLVYGWAFKSHLKVMRYFKNKISIVFRGDSTLLDTQNFVNRIKRKIILKWVYSHVNKALYVGTNNYAYFKSFGLKSNQLSFAPHAVDNQKFFCLDNACKEIAINYRRQLEIMKDDFVILFAGKFEPKKDPLLLAEAFISCCFPSSVHLLMVGNGILEDQLKSKCRDKVNIHFLEFQNQSNMPGLYACSDVFVLPSKGPGETWGLAVNEAMASGNAIIASDKCGCSADLIENGKNGFIFQAGNREMLREKLIEVYINKNASKMGQISKEIIREFSFEKIAIQIESIANNS